MIAMMAALAFAACAFADGKPGSEWYSPTSIPGHEENQCVIQVPDGTFLTFIGDDGKIHPVASSSEAFEAWKESAEFAKAIVAAMEQALIARNEVESLAAKLDTSVVTDVEEKDGVITWYKGISNGQGASGNRTKSGSATITKYKGDDRHIKLGGDNKTFSLNGNFAANKIYGVTANGFEECQFNVDEKSVDMNADGDAEIKGWKTATASAGTLAQQLEGKTQTHNNCLVLARAANGVAEFISIGNISGNGAVDNASTKTNASGKIEVYGFSGASRGAIPYRDATSLAWLPKSEIGYILTSRSSGLAWSGTAGGSMYYGTDIDGGLGWNMLPNVTTNAVETDNRTLKAEGRPGDPSKKIISLYTAPGANGLYGAYMADNHLAWSLITIPTNFPTIVDNKSINSNNTGAVQLYNWENLGNGVLCKNGDHPAITNVISKVTATNGVENIGGANDRVGLAGWTAPQCSTSLAAMLTSNAVDRADHRVLCRRETANGVEMHYASIGKLGGIGGGALKFVGNYDATAVVIGSGDTTNTVTFAALDEGENPSIKAKVEADGENGVIIKLGAFYK